MKRYWLADLRQKHGYTQTSISAELGIDRSNYNMIENGVTMPKLDTAIKISDKLGFNARRFMEGK
jgi:DNA-binding XRE family transcriptional regulator